MFSDEERATFEEALAKLEAERARRNKHKDAPLVDLELFDGRLARVLTGVPRNDAEAAWFEKNRPVPTAPSVPQAPEDLST
jgi:hypothetical protein